MLKINFPIIDRAIELKGATVLVLESISVYAKLVTDLYRYDDPFQIQIFEPAKDTLKASEIMIITDVLGFDLRSSTLTKQLCYDIESQFNQKPEVKLQIEQYLQLISKSITEECLDHDLDIGNELLSLSDIIKMSKIGIETKDDTIFEKMLTIIQVFQYVAKKKILIFINTLSYLTLEEIDSLFEYISLKELTILFIEPRKVNKGLQYIIDNDYFLTQKNMI